MFTASSSVLHIFQYQLPSMYCHNQLLHQILPVPTIHFPSVQPVPTIHYPPPLYCIFFLSTNNNAVAFIPSGEATDAVDLFPPIHTFLQRTLKHWSFFLPLTLTPTFLPLILMQRHFFPHTYVGTFFLFPQLAVFCEYNDFGKCIQQLGTGSV